MSHLRILVIAADVPPLMGGIATLTCSLARGLQMNDVSVRIITSKGAGFEEPIQDLRVIRFWPFLNRTFLKIIPLLAGSLRELSRQSARRVLAMVWTHDGVAAYLLRWILGQRYVLYAHGSEILSHRKNNLLRVIMRLVFQAADHVLTNSEFTRGLVLELGVPVRRVTVLHPPVSLPPRYEMNLAHADARFDLRDRRVLLTAARLVKRKGHAEVIEALAALRARYPDLVYVMTGVGEYSDVLANLARERAVQHMIRMPGFVSREELAMLYARAEIYVSPSREEGGDVEGFGIALVEAGTYGVPVIAGDSGGVADAVKHGETGLLVDGANIDQIVCAIATLLDDAELRQRLGSNGRSWTFRELSVSGQGAKLVAVLMNGWVEKNRLRTVQL